MTVHCLEYWIHFQKSSNDYQYDTITHFRKKTQHELSILLWIFLTFHLYIWYVSRGFYHVVINIISEFHSQIREAQTVNSPLVLL